MSGQLLPVAARRTGAMLLSLAVLPGCAATMEGQRAADTELAAGRQCFLPQQINGYSDAASGPDGEKRLSIHTGARDRWLMEAGACPELDFTSGIALDTRFNGTRLCAGEVATLIVPRGGAGAPILCEGRLLGRVARP